MSFLDDIVDAGSSVLGFLGGSGIGPALARTAITGYALNQLNKSVNQSNQVDNTAVVDPGVRLQLDVDPDNSIPVVYGEAWLGGIITDAELSADNSTMYYCITLCEQTGNTNLGAGPASVISFGEIYRNDMRVVFASDGVTVASMVDREGNVCTKPNGKITVRCYSNGSNNPVYTTPYPSSGTLIYARTAMPNWGVNHAMTGLVFAIIKVEYDATNDIRDLGDWRFQLNNSMYLPGDCLYDYMTNTVYGAGIEPGSIYLS